MTSRERFLAACACRPLDRPPVWIMRQAGRYLPEYRDLKARYSFLELVRTPELAAEVTMQPLRRFAFDAAILFSDILVVPEALGQGYRFKEEGGIAMEFRLETRAQLELLPSDNVRKHLRYVATALRLLRARLGDQTALLGFGGSPWTLACYMLEGGGSEDFPRARELFRADRDFFNALLDKLTCALIDYFKLQIESGVDAIQIFDSWGGLVAGRIMNRRRCNGSAGSLRRCRPAFPSSCTAKAPRATSPTRPPAACACSAWTPVSTWLRRTTPWRAMRHCSTGESASHSRGTSTRS